MSEGFPALGGLGPGLVVAGYQLEAQVGAGGMAVVFRARDQRLGRVVALKILAPALAADEGFRRRFVAESRAAAMVDDPHIIPVYEAGEAGGVLFIAMRFVAGGDLRGVLAREGLLAPGRAAGFVSPVASALDAAHRAGLVHRDVKPANVLVDARQDRPDHVYLSDFGVSKGAVLSVSLTGTGQFLGTPEYAAPEQVQGGAVDGRADQYALACVTSQLLTGAAPFERDQGLAVLLAHLSEPPPRMSARRPDLPAAADQVLAKALAKDPEWRYASCREFADALREALGVSPYTSPGTAAPGHPPAVVGAGPGSPGPDASTAAAGLADPADAWAVSGGSIPAMAGALSQKAGTVSAPGGPASQPDTVTVDAAVAGTEDGLAVGQTTGPGPGLADDLAQPARRPRRPRSLVIALACALLAAGVAVPLVLARPGTPHLSVSLTGTLTDPHGQSVDSVAFGPGGILAAGDGNDSTYLWDTATRKITATLTDPYGQVVPLFPYVDSVAFGPDSTLAVGDGDGSTYLWDTATGKITATLTDPESDGVRKVAFGPGGILAAGDGSGSTYLWDTATGKITATLTDRYIVDSLAFGPGGILAVGDGSGSTYLWDTATRKITATLTDPHSPGVDSLAFGPGGILAAGDGSGSTYLWDTATRKITATLTDPYGQSVDSVAFGPGGILAAGDSNGEAYLWDTARHTA